MDAAETADDVARLVEERRRCREARDWERADAIRLALLRGGVVCIDGAQGACGDTSVSWMRVGGGIARHPHTTGA